MKSNIALKYKAAVLLFLSLICGLSSARAEEEKHLPIESWIAIQAKFHEMRCSQYTHTQKLALLESGDIKNPSTYENTRIGVEFFCGCAPAALSAYSDTLTVVDQSKAISLKDFTSEVTPSISSRCIATNVRSKADATCMGSTFKLPDGVTNRATFCGCLTNHLKSMSDNSIAGAAESAQAELDEADKVMRGEVTHHVENRNQNLVDKILKACSSETK